MKIFGTSHFVLTKSHLFFVRTKVDKHSNPPPFFTNCPIYSSSDWSRARSFAKVIDYATVRSSICYFIADEQRCATLSCSLDLDEHCSAGRLYRCAWRARSRRTYTHATCERRIDAKASSEDAVVDVEVDRCIDENSASNYG